jgi:hypothetical protein
LSEVNAMPLIPCPACGRQISTEAEACPQCGHPNKPIIFVDDNSGPSCYACRKTATTRCQSCGQLSCAMHVNSIYVSHGRGGGYELRCNSCYSYAQAWQVIGIVIAAIVVIGFFIFVMGR